jgi:predicted nucleic acid-binding protein
MIIFVDTSALIALLDEDDRWHADAARAYRELPETATMVTTNYIQTESVALVRQRLGVKAVQRLAGAIFPALTTIWVDEPTHRAALAAHAAGGGASFVDHVSFAVMRQHGIELALAYDRDFELQGFRTVTMPGGDQLKVHEGSSVYARDSQAVELVSVAEISARAGRPVNTVQSWRRRHPDFPAPVAQLAVGPVWMWPAVEAWIGGRDRRGRSSIAAASG